MKTLTLTLEQRVQTFLLLGFTRSQSLHEMQRRLKLMNKLEPSETEKALIKYQYLDDQQTTLGYDRTSPALLQEKDVELTKNQVQDLKNVLSAASLAPQLAAHWVLPLCEKLGIEFKEEDDD